MKIVELRTDSERRAAFPVMQELRTHLTEAQYGALLDVMTPRGYRLFAVFEEAQIVALAGVEAMTNLYHGYHLWVYDLVTAAGARSRGYGAALMLYLERLARELGCEALVLSSGLQRLDAHRFYERRAHMRKTAFVFHRALD